MGGRCGRCGLGHGHRVESIEQVPAEFPSWFLPECLFPSGNQVCRIWVKPHLPLEAE